ncbi:MAG: hypothetical protein P1U37_05615 [Minwuia sp.]|nr:hypothetical protein [Minwuia sp.]
MSAAELCNFDDSKTQIPDNSCYVPVMDDVGLANYIAGLSRDHVEVGRVDRDISHALGGRLGDAILLSDYSLTKIHLKHPDITFEDYRIIPVILMESAIIIRRKKNRNTAELSLPPIEESLKSRYGYRLCLKPAEEGVFVTAFHRLTMQEARRHIRNGLKTDRLVREDSQGLAKQLNHLASPT